MPRRVAIPAVIACLAIGAVWLLFVALPRYTASKSAAPAAAPGANAPGGGDPAAPARKITATLYYVSEDGTDLVAVQRDVPFAESVGDQAREILTAQLGPAPAPYVSPVPEGSQLRTLYVTPRGDAFVDLSREARDHHPGGALDELFTVYTIVDALTVNLPAVQRVQILIDGQEVDTLAGHVDLRHPLPKSLAWVRTEPEKEKEH